MARTSTRISYVNGRYVNHAHAKVHIDDRGLQFSDGIYEVIAIENGVMIDEKPHFVRLKRSLKELRIATVYSERTLKTIIIELCRRNGLKDGYVYLQITRGVAKRNHPFPKGKVKPSLVVTISPPKVLKKKDLTHGVGVITHPDIRWGRRDIKSISLLPNILAKQAAVEAKAAEAWLVMDKGIISEGSSSNAYIVDSKGVLRTHPENEAILGGITRQTVLKLAKKKGVKVIEKPFSLKDAKAAKEAFITSTTAGVLPVTHIDGNKIGTGKVGPVTSLLLQVYREYVSTQTQKKPTAGKK